MIQLEKASFAFGPRTILAEADLTVPDGARVGLIGRNGAGKTTLFRILLRELALDCGDLVVPKDQRIVYLPQYPTLPPDQRVLDHVLESHPIVSGLQKEVYSLEEKMLREHDPKKLDWLSEKYRVLSREFEAQGGYGVDAKASEILKSLGFSWNDLWRKLGTLSPGEQNRVALAKVLLSDADVFLLDEPTNHLDFEMLEWLERFLTAPRRGSSGRPATAIVASHDRYFLNRFADSIVELTGGRLSSYRGNYDDFVARRAEELERQEKEYRLQQREIEKELEFIRRNFAAQRARQAKSREKKLARMEPIEAPKREESGPRIRFDQVSPLGDVALRILGLACGYGGKPLLSEVNLELRPGERVAVVGPNGCGKTTLLKCVVGEIEPLAGEVRRGLRTTIGYYPQVLSQEGSSQRVFDAVYDLVPKWTEQEVRDLLAAFLFRGEDIYQEIRSLSGGEMARLALIRLVLSGANLLILDEPTNHLDILARAALEESLLEFPGSILFVSHDRYFVERLATRVFGISGGALFELPGGYEEYREMLWRERDLGAEEKERPRARARMKSSSEDRSDRARRAEEERLVRRIAKAEEELKRKHEQAGLEEYYKNPEAMRRLKKEIEALEAEIEGLYRKWEELGA